MAASVDIVVDIAVVVVVGDDDDDDDVDDADDNNDNVDGLNIFDNESLFTTASKRLRLVLCTNEGIIIEEDIVVVVVDNSGCVIPTEVEIVESNVCIDDDDDGD